MPQKLPVSQASASEETEYGVTNHEIANIYLPPLEPPRPTPQANDSQESHFKTSDHTKHTKNTNCATKFVNYFRDRFFRGDISKSINRALRDYDV